MFKRIVIDLSGPICTCCEENLSWSVLKDEVGKFSLRVRCRDCGVELTVPPYMFIAGFSLDTPYPGKKTEPPKKEPRQRFADGKVVEMFLGVGNDGKQ